jgi:outer membrane immunogenic protein
MWSFTSMRMRLACLTVLAAALSAPATAADFGMLRGTSSPSLPPPPLMEVTPPASWDGFYIGGLAGYSSTEFTGARGPNDLVARNLRATQEIQNGAGELLSIPSFGARGAAFGAFAGYQMAFGEALMGVEVDYMSINRGGSASDVVARNIAGNTNTLTGSVQARMIDMATFRARFGYVMGSFMPYVTGGVAFGRGNALSTANVFTVGANNSFTYNSGLLVDQRSSTTMAGFTAGAGVEAMLGGLLVRGEYLYARLRGQGGLTTEVNQYRLGAGVKF